MFKRLIALITLFLTLLSLTAQTSHISLTVNSSCLIDNQFQARILGLEASIAGNFLFLWGCEGYHLYTMRKGFSYQEGEINEITFRLNSSQGLCNQKYGIVISNQLETVTNFRITKTSHTQRIDLRDQNGEILAFLVLLQEREDQKVKAKTLKGYYTLYLPPVILHFTSTGKITIKACNKIEGSYDLFSDGKVHFSNFSEHECRKYSEQFLSEAILSSKQISFTNIIDCEFQLAKKFNDRQSVVIEHKKYQQLPSLAGKYTLYLIGSALDSILVTVTDDRLSFRWCSSNSMKYEIIQGKKIEFSDFRSGKITQCETSTDNEYIEAFAMVKSLELNDLTNALRLLGNDQSTPIYSTQYEEYFSGNYTLYLIGSDLDPITVTVTDSQFIFQGCRQIEMRYEIKTSNPPTTDNQISFLNSPQANCEQGESNHYRKHIEQLRAVARFDLDKQTENLYLYHEQSHIPTYSTQLIDFLLSKPKFSLSGQYTLYLIGSALDSILVTVTDDRLSFQGCSPNSMKFAIIQGKKIEFSDFRSGKIPQCETSTDNEYIEAFSMVKGLELNDLTNALRLLGNDSSTPIYSTKHEEYLSNLPTPSLAGNYTLYLIGSDLDPFTVTVTDSQFIFQGCRQIEMRFHLFAQSEITFTEIQSEQEFFCKISSIDLYIQKFVQIVHYEFKQNDKQLKLFGNQSVQPLFSTNYQQFVSNTPKKSIAGNYTIYLIGLKMDPIIATATNERVVFHGCSKISMKYAIKPINMIKFSNFVLTNVCQIEKDHKYILKFGKVIRFELNNNTNALRLFGNDQSTPIYSTKHEEYLSNLPTPSLAGNYTLYLIGSDLDPITVTVTDSQFIFQGCRQIEMRYEIKTSNPPTTDNQISFLNSPQANCEQGESNHYRKHIEQLRAVARFDLDKQTENLYLYHEQSHIPTYSTQLIDFLLSKPKFSLSGQYTLYLIGSALDSILVTVTDDRLSFQGCSPNSMKFAIIQGKKIEFSDFRSGKIPQCETSTDNEYIEAFSMVKGLELNDLTNALRLLGNDSSTPIYSTKHEEYLSNLPTPSLAGNYTLYLIGSDLDPITVTVTDSQFIFQGCRQIEMRYEIKTSNPPTTDNQISFLNSPQANCEQGESNHYRKHIEQLRAVARFDLDKQTENLYLYHEQSHIPTYSTQLIDFLLSKPKFSLSGQYTLYLIGSALDSILVTVTDDRLSFQGCSPNSMKFAIIQGKKIEFSDFRSGKIPQCETSTDNEYIEAFSMVKSLELNDLTNALRLLGNDSSTPIYSTKHEEYLSNLPTPSLAGNYTLYLIGSDLDPITVTVTDSQFIFQGCRQIEMRFHLFAQSEITFTHFQQSGKNICQTSADNQYMLQFARVSAFKFEKETKQLRFFRRNMQKIIFSTQSKDNLLIQQKESIIGLYTLYLIGSDLDPVTVSFTENKFKFQGCRQIEMDYAVNSSNSSGMGDLINFSSVISTNSPQCQLDYDHEYIRKFNEIVRLDFRQDTRTLKLFDQYSQNPVFSTQLIEYLLNQPRYSIAGSYTLYPIGTRLNSIEITVTQDQLIFQGCEQISMTYVIRAQKEIKFADFASTNISHCQDSSDSLLIIKFSKITILEFHRHSQQLKLFGENSENLVFSTESEEYYSSRPKLSLVGRYTLYLIGSDLDPVTVSVTENRFTFEGCRQIDMKYALIPPNSSGMGDLIKFFQATSANSPQCQLDYDHEYIRKFNEIVRLDFRQDTRTLKLFDQYSQNPVFSTQRIEYLLNQPRYSIAGSYTLYPIGTRLNSIEITVTQDQLSFQGCEQISMTYVIRAQKEIKFADFASTNISHCQGSSDSLLIIKFSKITILEFHRHSQQLKLFGENSENLVFSTESEEYYSSRPKLSLVGRYTLYLIGSDLDPVTVSVTENRFTFEGCRQIDMKYALIPPNSSGMGDLIKFFQATSANSPQCQLDYDHEYIRKFNEIVRLDFLQDTRTLKLFDQYSQNPVFSTQRIEYLLNQPRYSIAGSYTLYPIGTRLNSIEITVTQDQLSFQGCEQIIMTYVIRAQKEIKFADFASTNISHCQDSSDSLLIIKFSKITILEFHRHSQQLKLFGENSENLVFSTESEEYYSSRPKLSLVGRYTLYLIGSDLDPVTVSVTENRFTFEGCRQIDMKYALIPPNSSGMGDLIKLFQATSANSPQCQLDYDHEYIRKFNEIVRLDFRQDTRTLKLFDQYSQNPVFSTQRIEYLLNQPRYSIAGSYTLYPIGTRLNSIEITVTQDQLSFQGCEQISMTYVIRAQKEIKFADFASTNISHCQDSSDSLLIIKFSKITILEFHRHSQQLKLFGENSENLVFSTESEEYYSSRPKLSLVGRYTLYLIGSDLDPVTVSVTENRFLFEICVLTQVEYFFKGQTQIQFSLLFQPPCGSKQESQFTKLLLQVGSFEFNFTKRSLKLRKRNSKKLLFSTQSKDNLLIQQKESIIGLYTLYLIGSDLNPVTVSFTENKFKFQGCRQIEMDYAVNSSNSSEMGDLINFSSVISTNSPQCQLDYDHEYIRKFNEIVRLDFRQDTRTLKLFDQYSQNPVFSTQRIEYLLNQPRYSIAGSYTLYPIGTRLNSIEITVTQDQLSFQGCEQISMTYVIRAQKEIKFADFASTNISHCQDSSDSLLIIKFSKITILEFHRHSQQLKLFGENSENLVFSTESEEYYSSRPKLSLVGRYTLYLIGSDLDPVTVSVTENRFTFEGCRQIDMKYALIPPNSSGMGDLIKLFQATSANSPQCQLDYDHEYIRKFNEIVRLDFRQDTRTLKLFDQYSQNPVFSTQRIEYLLNQPRYSIAGSYTLYPIGTRLNSIEITVTQDQLSFQGCEQISMTYVIRAQKEIKFADFASTNISHCQDSSDSLLIIKFSKITILEFHRHSQQLKLFGENSENLVFSTESEEYYSSRPKLSLVGRYTLYLIGSDLDPVTVSVTENRFTFEGCRQIDMKYALIPPNSSGMGDLIKFFQATSANSPQCQLDYDHEYIRKFNEIVRLDFRQDTRTLKLFDQYSQNPVFSTQLIQYLLNMNQSVE